MPKIFISYRREDTEYSTQGIYSGLADRFGKESVVFDVDSIPIGKNFRDHLNQEVGKCDILLAIIGDKWLDILKQRLNDLEDFVRIEIQAALDRDIPLVPVLVKNASVPSEADLPPELSQLAYKQAAEVRAGSDYQVHLKRLIDGLDYLLTGCKTTHPTIKEKENFKFNPNDADESATDFDKVSDGIDKYYLMSGLDGFDLLTSDNINDYLAWYIKMDDLMPFGKLPSRTKILMKKIGDKIYSYRSDEDLDLIISEVHSLVSDLDDILEEEGYRYIY